MGTWHSAKVNPPLYHSVNLLFPVLCLNYFICCHETLSTLNTCSFISTLYHTNCDLRGSIEKSGSISNLKLGCYILKSDNLWNFCYDTKEFPTKLKVDTLNNSTHRLLSQKNAPIKPQAPQPEDRKKANYFRVLILKISQESTKNGHKPSHIYNELPILLFQLMLH